MVLTVLFEMTKDKEGNQFFVLVPLSLSLSVYVFNIMKEKTKIKSQKLKS
jgi:hypothetical protein